MTSGEAEETVRVCLRLDAARLARWHVWLAEALAALPRVELCVEQVKSRALPGPARALLALERMLYGGEHACDQVAVEELPARLTENCGACDFIVDTCGDGAGLEGVIAVLFDGVADEAAALGAVLEGRAPWLDLVIDGRRVPVGLPALEDAQVASRALDCVLARAGEALVRAVKQRLHYQGRDCPPPSPPEVSPARGGAFRAAHFVLSALAFKAGARIARLVRAEERWMVGWREIGVGESVRVSLAFNELQYCILPDEGRRYFADPFIVVHNGRRFVFVEEYPYATGKGVISVFEVDGAGRAGAPRVVLEEDVHLSYPHVFSHGGEIWMIPESEAGRKVALYRAVRFPDRWERAQVLLEDVAASDATVFHDGSTWWMFAALRRWTSSSWDGLGLFMADELAGPWRPHSGNPVLVDARSGRPAGGIYRHGGALWRPAQYCIGSYGAGLALCRIEQLNEACFLQTAETVLRPRHLSGFHTLNLSGGLEVVDLFGRSSSVEGRKDGLSA